MEKLEVLADAAKYDVACTSSGVTRAGKKGQLGATSSGGFCHAFTADGRCVSLLKVLLTNVCCYDCAYCVNRRSNDVARAMFTPRELADLTIAFYRRNYIEGLFLSSGVVRDPDYTMELIIETARILREDEGFLGYIHAKSIPGASPALVQRLGYLVDRMSVNVELPSQCSLDVLAPEKARQSVTAPMRLLSEGITANAEERQLARRKGRLARMERFVPAGQSTQLIIGATPETDHHILTLAESLYRSYKLKRVFFSAYLPVNDDARLPGLQSEVPLTREHRLFQADWLLRFYGFSVSELVSCEQPDLPLDLDPKAAWALRHMEQFPVEVNSASYEELLRVPGIGVKMAHRIVRARTCQRLGFGELASLGVTLKRAGFFITCKGRVAEGFDIDPSAARASLTASSAASGLGRKKLKGAVAGQMSLFDESCQQAHDPFARAGHTDRLLDAARAQVVQARLLQQEALSTPSGLPSYDALVVRGSAEGVAA